MSAITKSKQATVVPASPPTTRTQQTQAPLARSRNRNAKPDIAVSTFRPPQSTKNIPSSDANTSDTNQYNNTNSAIDEHQQAPAITHYRAPFPSTIEILFSDPPALPILLFNFTHSARTSIGDITKAHRFHTACLAPTFLFDHNPKLVAVPYPPGLVKLYYARAGNVGLEFVDLESLKAFQKGICGVGHLSVKKAVGLFKCYLGNKMVEEAVGRFANGCGCGGDVANEYGELMGGGGDDRFKRRSGGGRHSRGAKGRDDHSGSSVG